MSLFRLGIAVALLLGSLPAAGQTLRVGNGTEPPTLDPALSESVPDIRIERDLYEGLVVLDRNAQPLPGQAESWTISPDGLTYVFTLRPGLVWSNGAPASAEDYVYSWRRAADPATGSKYGFLFYPIKNAEGIVNGTIKDVASLGVRAVNARTLEITLKAPSAYFLGMLAHGHFLPVYRKAVEQFGNQFTRPANMVSNGAFTLKEWTPQSRVVLVKNPNYRDAANVKLQEVDYLPIENQNEELKRYRAGEIDITSDVPSDQMDLIRRDLAGEFHVWPYLGAYYLGFNLTQPPFKDNPKLRQAFAMVIDREAIAEKIIKTGEIPAYGWVPPGIPGYQAQFVPWHDMPMAERIRSAQQLYRDAGYGPDKPLTVELRYNTSENHKKIMIAVASMLKQALGVQVTLVNEEFKVFLDNRERKKVTQLFRDGWIADYADPNSFLELLQSDSGLNDMGYSNADYDKLVKEAAVTIDPAKRFGLLEQAEALVLRDLPVLPLYAYVNKRLVKPYVQGFEPNILGEIYSRDISLAPH